MASESILTSTKKILGLDESYTIFDLDIITHINSAFMTLSDLGMGPQQGFMIVDKDATWDSFVEHDLRVNAAKTYVYLKTRLAFDPPQNQSVLASMERQVTEMEWRINVRQESTDWRPGVATPFPEVPMGEPIILDGGSGF